MRPVTVTLTGDGGNVTNSSPAPVNWRGGDLGLMFTTSGSTTGFTVQYTLSDPTAFTSASDYNGNGTWLTLGTMSSLTATKDGELEMPIRAVRLQGNASGTDTGTLVIVQRDTGLI